MAFFVLSGCLVSATVLKHNTQTWSWRTYAVSRLARLYVVLIDKGTNGQSQMVVPAIAKAPSARPMRRSAPAPATT